ncbi:hypothetical protein [Hansschlegelia plantiphila]|nr:hypothetical protein [Hansschlegelia plantiphila]
MIAVRTYQNVFDADATLRFLKNYWVAASFCWLLVSMRHAASKPLERVSGFNRRMADFSFSLYLIHFPTALFLLSAAHATGWFPKIAEGYGPTDGAGVSLYLGVMAVVYLLAWAFSRQTEARTWLARRWLRRRLQPTAGRRA